MFPALLNSAAPYGAHAASPRTGGVTTHEDQVHRKRLSLSAAGVTPKDVEASGTDKQGCYMAGSWLMHRFAAARDAVLVAMAQTETVTA